MSDINAGNDSLNFPELEENKLPGYLNVLTILTFIGSGLGLVSSFLMPALLKFGLKALDMKLNSGETMTTSELQKYQDQKTSSELLLANASSIMIIGIICTGLCLWGAFQMRKLKLDGYWIYIAGCLLYYPATYIILGSHIWDNLISFFAGIAFTLLFILLYGSHKKYFTK